MVDIRDVDKMVGLCSTSERGISKFLVSAFSLNWYEDLSLIGFSMSNHEMSRLHGHID